LTPVFYIPNIVIRSFSTLVKSRQYGKHLVLMAHTNMLDLSFYNRTWVNTSDPIQRNAFEIGPSRASGCYPSL